MSDPCDADTGDFHRRIIHAMKKTIRKYIKDFILQFLIRRPCRFKEKLRMVGIVIFGNWSMSSNMLLYPFRGKFPLTTQEKVIDTYGNGKIDEQSFQNALQYLSYVQRADDQIIHLTEERS
ncbi:MAG: hypothetical protein EOM50_15320, partial [Erysipelotrichia bacterium]|nr:hypothetical protein [Erysipelotrichia bacterium]